MKVICISDCHGKLPVIAPCDLLLIAGDICPHAPSEPIWEGGQVVRVMRPRVGSAADVQFQARWLDSTFRAWLEGVPASRVVATWGNHDWVGQKRPEIVPKLRWDLLVDESVDVAGLKIWATPWQPWFHDWAFNAPVGEAGDRFLAGKLAAVPSDTDVVVSHGPPRGYGDRTNEGCDTGSIALRELMGRTSLKLIVTGHIHEGYGVYRHPSGCSVANASILNDRYDLVNPPLAFEM